MTLKELLNKRNLSIRDFDGTSKEGRLLLAAIALLTTGVHSNRHPDKAFEEIVRLATQMYVDEQLDSLI